MNATANSGSIPDEQPAMIEMVPVGATVVTLQLRSSCIGRMRSPFSSRAHVSSGPQMDRAHSGNGATLVREALALALGLDVDELHAAAAELDAFGRVVRDAQTHERVGEAHDAETDAADALGQRVDLGERILVDVDDVVEEVRGEMHVALHRIPVQHAVLHVVADVDRAEVADVVRKQRLLAARIRRLVRAQVRDRIVAVGLVDEEAARLARAPGAHRSSCPTPCARRAARRPCR